MRAQAPPHPVWSTGVPLMAERALSREIPSTPLHLLQAGTEDRGQVQTCLQRAPKPGETAPWCSMLRQSQGSSREGTKFSPSEGSSCSEVGDDGDPGSPGAKVRVWTAWPHPKAKGQQWPFSLLDWRGTDWHRQSPGDQSADASQS